MRPLLLCLILAACSSASPRYLGTKPSRAEVDGWRIDVYHKGNAVQAIRLNATLFPARDEMAYRAVVAIEGTTGCEVVKGSMRGDAVVVNARVKCP